MRHYVLDTYHGPLVFTQRRDDWVISSPCQQPEVFSGRIPPSCLATARPISTSEAEKILGACPWTPWSDVLPAGDVREQLATVA